MQKTTVIIFKGNISISNFCLKKLFLKSLFIFKKSDKIGFLIFFPLGNLCYFENSLIFAKTPKIIFNDKIFFSMFCLKKLFLKTKIGQKFGKFRFKKKTPP